MASCCLCVIRVGVGNDKGEEEKMFFLFFCSHANQACFYYSRVFNYILHTQRKFGTDIKVIKMMTSFEIQVEGKDAWKSVCSCCEAKHCFALIGAGQMIAVAGECECISLRKQAIAILNSYVNFRRPLKSMVIRHASDETQT